MTRKRIAAAFLALALAVGLTVPALAADSGTRTSLEDYTAENSAHAILDYMKTDDSNPYRYTSSYAHYAYYDPSHNADHIQTSLGNCKETWEYIAKNFGEELAFAWHNTETSGDGGAHPVLDYLLQDADRQFAFVRDNYSSRDLEHWFYYEVIWSSADANLFIRPKTDASVMNYFASITPVKDEPEETPEPTVDPTTTLDGPEYEIFEDKEANTVSTLYRNMLSNTTTYTTFNYTTGQLRTSVRNMESGGARTNVTNTLDILPSPAKPATIQVDGKPVTLCALVEKDGAGNETNYFRLRDVGDAVGFEVGWSAQTGITAQTAQPKEENPWDLPELPTHTVFHDDIMGRIITTTSETDSRGKETVTTVLETAALKGIMTITKDMSTVGRQSTKTKRLDAARPIPAPTARQVTITANGKSVTLDALVLLDIAGNETNYFKLRDLGSALGFQVDWTAETGITVTTD